MSPTRQQRREAERRALAQTSGGRGLPDSMAPKEFGQLRAALRAILARRSAGAAVLAAEAAAKALDERARPLSARHTLACAKGCDFCCHGQQVPVSAPEALRIAAFVGARRPDLALRVRAADVTTRGRPKAEVKARMLPCPFLETGACQIYPVRPLACRAFVSLDVEPCKVVFRGGEPLIPTPRAFMLLEDFCVSALCWAAAKLGLKTDRYELHAAVADALAAPDAERRWLAGEDVFALAKGHPSMGNAPAAPPPD